MILKVNFICGDCVCFIIVSSIDLVIVYDLVIGSIDLVIVFMIVFDLEEIYFSNIS